MSGTPGLHKLMPPLGVLLDRCFKIALVADGRLSSASGKVPSAIHVIPEAYDGEPLVKVRDRDIIRVNGQTGELTLLVDETELVARGPHIPDLSASCAETKRGLFNALHEKLFGAEQGATCITFQDDKSVVGRGKTLMKNWKTSAGSVLTTGPVVPVIVVKKLERAVPMAEALAVGGVRILEVTLRTKCTVDVIRVIAEKVSEAIVNAGTVLNPQQLAEVTEAGVQSAISPSLTEPLLEAVAEGAILLIPGTSTVSELMLGMDYGLKEFKFFPTEVNGGARTLQTVAGPFSQIRFCPTGDISPVNYRDYLALKSMLCISGSWLVPIDALEAGDYNRITELAREAVEGAKL